MNWWNGLHESKNMLKLNIGWNQERLAQQLAFGLSEGNLKKLQHGAPIFITGKEMKVDVEGFVIFGCRKDPDLFKQDFEDVFEMLPFEPEGDQPVLNIEESLYIAPVPVDSDVVYFIGLHEVSYEKLRNNQRLTFRCRIIEGEGQNVEVNLFWGETEEAMAKDLGLSEMS